MHNSSAGWDVVILNSSPILKLLASKNQALLVGKDTLLAPNSPLYPLD